jgi:hypothetical protein
MQVIILTCFESNEERVSFVVKACKLRKYDVSVISTDFSHIKKQKRTNIPESYQVIETKPYSRNLSIGRMISHYKFSKDAFKLIEKEDPDLIWLMAPANSLIKQANKYKKKHPNVKLIIDIIDMWPESLPIKLNRNIPPLSIWRSIRSKYINCADALVSECDFYQDILSKEYNGKIQTIRWCRDSKVKENDLKIGDDKLSLVYIGSINNIISVEILSNVISNIDMPVVLHVIGEGENRYNFVNVLSRNCEVIYHGAIRDEKQKAKIFDMCHAGVNIYKDNLYIGLTVKCIDYFEHGLPIINNIKGDTYSMVEKYNFGINVDENTKVDGNKLIKMRKNNKYIYDFYNNNFTKEVFIDKCLDVIDEVIK